MNSHLESILLAVGQVLVWALLILAPGLIGYLIVPEGGMHSSFFALSFFMIAPMAIVYLINFYLLVPLLFFRKHYWSYALAVVGLIAIGNYNYWLADVSQLEVLARVGFYTYWVVNVVIYAIVTLAALGLRYYLRTRQLQTQYEENKRKMAEAELNWLKNQLNPHFLFNSLNNISSLTQIDPDLAQESIAQLSDLLRYALYESNKPRVPLAGEIDFMNNYISLMRLRCSSTTQVEVDLLEHTTAPALPDIPPLLFISFIENAFKHGVSNNQPSSIRISLSCEGETVKFSCSNTNLPKTTHDRSGSGIGLENTRRRLDLCYPGAYTWNQRIEDGIYNIEVVLN